MEMIAPNVYLETSFPGVTVGAFVLPQGLIYVDAPLLPEHVQSWRASLIGLSSGNERVLLLLDAHADRALNARLMECAILTHEKAAHQLRSRPPTSRSSGEETGSAWEIHGGGSTVRWSPPELSFSENLFLHWDAVPVIAESRPGPNPGAIWVRWERERVLFVGDAVCKDQPPFLAAADIPQWLAQLQLLLQPEYADYLIVSGRGGLVPLQVIRAQMSFLEATQEHLQKVPFNASDEVFETLARELLERFRFPQEPQYFFRLRHGLKHYHTRRQPALSEEAE